MRKHMGQKVEANLHSWSHARPPAQVMDLCQGGDLYEMLRDVKYLGEERAAPLMLQALRAVQYCHSMGVVHRDIKPENFLLAKKVRGTRVQTLSCCAPAMHYQTPRGRQGRADGVGGGELCMGAFAGCCDGLDGQPWAGNDAFLPA